jgi:hypothetical protein
MTAAITHSVLMTIDLSRRVRFTVARDDAVSATLDHLAVEHEGAALLATVGTTSDDRAYWLAGAATRRFTDSARLPDDIAQAAAAVDHWLSGYNLTNGLGTDYRLDVRPGVLVPGA